MQGHSFTKTAIQWITAKNSLRYESEDMTKSIAYREAKVYFDGNHYIAIPKTLQKRNYQTKQASAKKGSASQKRAESFSASKKEVFESVYKKNIDLSKRAKKQVLLKEIQPYFEDTIKAREYVEQELARKARNSMVRQVRMTRKANLANFNYFATFTYDSKKHTEESFKKKLKNKLALLAYRQGWKYMGVWERSPEKNRLHFHRLFHIAKGKLLGELIAEQGYSFKRQKRQRVQMHSYFLERFGRNDFQEIDKRQLGDTLAYLMKYIEKTGERIVYSKGLYQYFISDIEREDIAARVGIEERKLLLFDDFTCIQQDKVLGKVSTATIQQCKKSN